MREGSSYSDGFTKDHDYCDISKDIHKPDTKEMCSTEDTPSSGNFDLTMMDVESNSTVEETSGVLSDDNHLVGGYEAQTMQITQEATELVTNNNVAVGFDQKLPPKNDDELKPSTQKEFICNSCPRKYRSFGSLQRHLRFECSNAKYKCPLTDCKYKAKNISNVTKHVSAMHPAFDISEIMKHFS
ncbi:hypothetical protein GWI33_014864 [Rhynchophorus ferrugineus]|uniref:C2H2-type domain-containing protein n=1 Tax=Rhynchophorus ferrugineus TaxID=354439 RepID=A0A834I0R4_RHYFE|nr:hypothetical protein GWI33_014864 [Rhynchophorus ferrugineus]